MKYLYKQDLIGIKTLIEDLLSSNIEITRRNYNFMVRMVVCLEKEAEETEAYKTKPMCLE